MNDSLKGRVALVTGASRGIGEGIARRFAAEGAAVAVTARSVDPHPTLPGTLTRTAERIEAAGGRCLVVQADLCKPEDRARLIESVRGQLGPIDVLVNNAARAFYEPCHSISQKRLRLSLELNFIAPYDLSQRVIPDMRSAKAGWILNIGSATAELPEGPPYGDFDRAAGVGTYASTKSALNRLTTAMAAEVHRDGIAVNMLAPVAAVLTEAAVALGVIGDDAATEPLEEMAEAALALCSGSPETLTGRLAYSGPLLAELGRAVKTLDGSAVYTE
jgi:NAD(P)-dependent dehydrogenase (short-subunit alcohol dehydrogenase family)